MARFNSTGLAAGVHLALADNRIVILDVGRDRYLRIERGRSVAFAQAVRAEAARSVWAALGARSLLNKPKSESAISPWQASLGRHDLSPLLAAGVLGACHWASRTLRQMPFADVLRAVHFKPKRVAAAPELHRAVQSFLVHRPLYPRDYACMFEALALLRYLSVRGFRATWMFGVRGAPFTAHCWLEHEGVVLNDDPDVIRAFKPIMAA